MSSSSSIMTCSSSYGSAINPSDCNIAISIFHANLQSQSQITLPRGSYFHTCAVGVSESNSAADIAGTSTISSGLSRQQTDLMPSLAFLIDTCVSGTPSRSQIPTTSRRSRRGGVLRRDGLTFVVVNPMQVPVWGTCLAPTDPSGMDLGQCIEWRLGFGRAWNDPGQTRGVSNAVEAGSGQVSEQGGEGEESLLDAIRTSGQGSVSQQEAGPHQLAAGHNVPAPFGSEIGWPRAPENDSTTTESSDGNSLNITVG